MTDPKKTNRSTNPTDPENPPTLREQVTEKEAELVMGKPLSTEPPAEPPAPGAPVDPEKAAKNRKILLELDAHDIRREGAYVAQAQGSVPAHYMPPVTSDVVASDSVLAAEGALDPSKMDAAIAEAEKFQRPGFVDQLKKRLEEVAPNNAAKTSTVEHAANKK